MAIIHLTQKTFSKVLSENIDKMGIEGMFASAILGGKDKLKEAITDMPDENLLWVDTDHVVAASGPIKMSDTGDVVFRIYFGHPDAKENPVWIKGDDYKRFILTWAGEETCINEGEYEVPSGYRVTACEDGKKIKVEKIEDK